ncbi:MAG: ATP-binding protein [Bacteroidetes bacterium]|nr:ATP-binding protein [Bacteroidota bacterium]
MKLTNKYNNDFLKNVLDNISDAILFESFDHTILYVNKHFCNLFKVPVSPNKLIGIDCSNVAQSAKKLFKDPERFVNRINQVYLNKENIVNEEVFFKDGRVVYMDYTIIDDVTGKGHMWTYKNMSILKTSLETITGQKEFYENLLNNIPADIAIFNDKHQYVFVNSIGVKSTELSKWIIGKDDFEYVSYRNRPKSIAERRRAAFDKAKLTQKSVEMEEISINDKNISTHILRKFYPVYENGEFLSMIGYGIDITSIRESEKEVIVMDALFSTLIENTNELVITVDSSLKIQFANAKWINKTGFSYYTTLQSSISNFISENENKFIETLNYFFEHEQYNTNKREVVINAFNKNKITLKFDLTKYSQKGWETPRVMIFFTDITEQVKNETEFKKNLTKEKHLNELKTNFMNMVSHELRTPLSVILSNTELLVHKLQKIQNDTVKKHTDMIINQIDGMINLLNEFLFISKVESGKILIQLESISIVEQIKKITKEQFNPWIDGRKVAIKIVNKPRDVYFDIKMLGHIVSNLFNNAFKYSSGASNPVLEIKFYSNKFVLNFIDQGIGISLEDQKKLFQPFARGENVGLIEGTGLGLVIVKYFSEQHNGEISIESQIDKGTTISLTFPYLIPNKETIKSNKSLNFY